MIWAKNTNIIQTNEDEVKIRFNLIDKSLKTLPNFQVRKANNLKQKEPKEVIVQVYLQISGASESNRGHF